MRAVAGQPVRLPAERRRDCNPVPQPPDQQARPIAIARHHVLDQRPAELPPQRMVVTVDLRPLRHRRARHRRRRPPLLVDHPHVREVARHPLRAGPVRRQRHVQPHVKVVLLGQVEQPVELIQFVLPGSRLHPVPHRETAHDPEPARPDPRQVRVPHLRLRRRRPVVLHPHRKRNPGNPKSLVGSHRLTRLRLARNRYNVCDDLKRPAPSFSAPGKS